VKLKKKQAVVVVKCMIVAIVEGMIVDVLIVGRVMHVKNVWKKNKK
jgi:hypothetical protein